MKAFEITIKRRWEHYAFKVMLPIFLILCVAWYVLWIPTFKYEARLNTSIIALLALIAYNFVFQDLELFQQVNYKAVVGKISVSDTNTKESWP